jgi:hypothetical protein
MHTNFMTGCLFVSDCCVFAVFAMRVRVVQLHNTLRSISTRGTREDARQGKVLFVLLIVRVCAAF